jgi:hypothetical protein
VRRQSLVVVPLVVSIAHGGPFESGSAFVQAADGYWWAGGVDAVSRFDSQPHQALTTVRERNEEFGRQLRAPTGRWRSTVIDASVPAPSVPAPDLESLP